MKSKPEFFPQLICKFFYVNHDWTIEEYDRRRDPAKQVKVTKLLCSVFSSLLEYPRDHLLEVY